MKIYLSLICLIFSIVIQAQTFQGTVYDIESGEKLPGATVLEIQSGGGTITDANGLFELALKKGGVYSIEIRYLGYNTKIIQELSVKANTVKTIHIGLAPDANGLDSLIITDRIVAVQPGKLSITEEQLNRFAATYYDPARMMVTSPDVSVTNDQNNQISVRGISPAFNIWRLAGAEILNPNHLSNAGTLSDQPVSNGGGVNILSAQMMDNSTFEYGNFGANLGNSVGGIFNMEMKQGSKEYNHIAQASLIGFDFASEGSLIALQKLTYAANYRYSFTGLLGAFGVDFGGETIGFQDLSFNTSYKVNEFFSIDFFGLGGLNYNKFQGKTLAESEKQKDRSDIDFDGKMGAVGLSLKYDKSGVRLLNTFLFSSTRNIRDQQIRNNQDIFETQITNSDQRNLFSHRFDFTNYYNGVKINLGVLNNFYSYDYERSFDNDVIVATSSVNLKYDISEILIQPYLSVGGQITHRWYSELGINSSVNVKGKAEFDPRFSTSYQLKSNESIALGVGRYSQLLGPESYFYYNPFQELVGDRVLNPDFDFINSWRFSFSHAKQFKWLSITSEVFRYVFLNPRSTQFTATEASSTGVSITLDKSFSNDYYLRLGCSYFNSEIDPNSEDNIYNSRFNVNFSGGKQWTLKSGKEMSVNLRSIYQGGQHFPELQVTDTEVIDQYQTQDYLRFDLRWQLVNHHAHWTSTFSIDVQNVLNRENESFRYYDSFTQQIETQYQLGMIPILTYRVGF